jgi:excisionase family DNA binding protein
VLTIADIEDRATIAAEESFEVLGIGRSTGYESIKRGEIPVLRLGRCIRVPVPALLKLLGMEPPANQTATTVDQGDGSHDAAG